MQTKATPVASGATIAIVDRRLPCAMLTDFASDPHRLQTYLAAPRSHIEESKDEPKVANCLRECMHRRQDDHLSSGLDVNVRLDVAIQSIEVANVRPAEEVENFGGRHDLDHWIQTVNFQPINVCLANQHVETPQPHERRADVR